MDLTHFNRHGWVISPPEPALLTWAKAAHRAGLDILRDADMRTRWLDCEETWFVGVDVLPNAPDGGLGAVPLAGAAIDALGALHPEHRDVTVIYQAARRQCFECCNRVDLHAAPGQAILLHRHLRHGIGAWSSAALAPAEGRMIAYFRPLACGGIEAWKSRESLV